VGELKWKKRLREKKRVGSALPTKRDDKRTSTTNCARRRVINKGPCNAKGKGTGSTRKSAEKLSKQHRFNCCGGVLGKTADERGNVRGKNNHPLLIPKKFIQTLHQKNSQRKKRSRDVKNGQTKTGSQKYRVGRAMQRNWRQIERSRKLPDSKFQDSGGVKGLRFSK